MEQCLGVLVVVIHHEVAIPLDGSRSGPLVEDCLHLAKICTVANTLNKVEPIHIVGDIQVCQVVHLAPVGEVIDHQNIGLTALIQRLDDIAADKPCTTGYYNHDFTPLSRTASSPWQGED